LLGVGMFRPWRILYDSYHSQYPFAAYPHGRYRPVRYSTLVLTMVFFFCNTVCSCSSRMACKFCITLIALRKKGYPYDSLMRSGYQTIFSLTYSRYVIYAVVYLFSASIKMLTVTTTIHFCLSPILVFYFLVCLFTCFIIPYPLPLLKHFVFMFSCLHVFLFVL
jgi:hypothetical protein